MQVEPVAQLVGPAHPVPPPALIHIFRSVDQFESSHCPYTGDCAFTKQIAAKIPARVGLISAETSC